MFRVEVRSGAGDVYGVIRCHARPEAEAVAEAWRLSWSLEVARFGWRVVVVEGV